MLNNEQRTRAYLRYLEKPMRDFLPLLIGLVVLLLAGGVAFHTLYDEPVSFSMALFVTFALVFMEHVLPFPEHWLLQAFYVIVPPLGLIIILDGIVRFSFHLLRRDADSPAWNKAMTQTLSDHVILVGLGNVGFRTLETLLRLGEKVAVLEKDEDCANIPFARHHGVPILIGTGREEGILEALGIDKAKSLICASDDDLANLEIAIDARAARPEIRVVLRMYDQALAAKVKANFDIELAFSTSAMAAPVFATASSDRSIEAAINVGKRLFVVARLEVRADSKLQGTVGALTDSHAVFVLTHRRGGSEHYCPPADLTLEAGDRLVVQAEPAVLQTLHRLNADTGL